MQTIATLYWFRFERHAQVELLLNPDDIPDGEWLAALHGKRVKIQIDECPPEPRAAHEREEERAYAP